MSVLGRAWIRAGAMIAGYPAAYAFTWDYGDERSHRSVCPISRGPAKGTTTQLGTGDAGLGVDRARCNSDLLWQNDSGEAAHPLAPGS